MTEPTFEGQAQRQVEAAKARLAIDPLTLPRLPWESVVDLVGELWPQQHWIFAAESGHGKSTALLNVAYDLLRRGRVIWHAPLEQGAELMRLYLAAYALELPSPRVLRNKLSDAELVRVNRHIDWQQSDEGWLDGIGFSEVPILTPESILHLLQEASNFGAEILMIDHLNHMDQGSAPNPYVALKRICNAIVSNLKRMPYMRIISAAQIRRDQSNKDPLAKYYPPRESMIEGGGCIQQTANVVLGFWRPLKPGLSDADRADVRLGNRDETEMLEPNVVGVKVLKDRTTGNVGKVVRLDYHRGRITCPQSEHRDVTEQRYGL